MGHAGEGQEKHVQHFAQELHRDLQVEKMWMHTICLCGRNHFAQSASSYLEGAGSCSRTWKKPCGGECGVAAITLCL